MSEKKWISSLSEVDGPGQYYHKDGHGAPFTIDTEIPDHGDDDVYVICVQGKWLSDGWKLKTFKTIAGCKKCLEALATKRAGDMGYWLNSGSFGGGSKLKGAGYKFRPKRR